VYKKCVLILVNDQLDALFSMYLLHASTCFEQQVLIIRRIKFYQYIIWYNTIYLVTVLCADRHTTQSPTRVFYTRWCIDTIWSSWWWALVPRNMYRREINTLKKCVKLVNNKNYVEMLHGQQNMKERSVSVYVLHKKHIRTETIRS
jgi:hypothetical protein